MLLGRIKGFELVKFVLTSSAIVVLLKSQNSDLPHCLPVAPYLRRSTYVFELEHIPTFRAYHISFITDLEFKARIIYAYSIV